MSLPLRTPTRIGEAWKSMAPLLHGKTLLVYGVDFDIRLLEQSAAASGLQLCELDAAHCYCVMEAYAVFRGLPDKNPHRRYRRHKLVDACASMGITLHGAHDAAADAEATARLLQALAQVPGDEPAGC